MLSYQNGKNYVEQRIRSTMGTFAMAAMFFMVIQLTAFMWQEEAMASEIQIGAQLTDAENMLGTLSGRFNRDFESADLYILAYSPALDEVGAEAVPLYALYSNERRDMEEGTSVCMTGENGMTWQWRRRPEIAPLGRYDRIVSGQWGTLRCVDYAPFKGKLPSLSLLMLLVNAGEDPYDPSNWLDMAITTLITDPSARVPGQTAFVSNGTAYRDNVVPLDAEPGAVPDPDAMDDKEGEDGDLEKPDIYKIDGNRLYYANGSADRFQVIDLSHPERPEMQYTERLDGSPQDLYVVDGYVVLLQQESHQGQVAMSLKIYQQNGESVESVANETYPDLSYLNSKRSGNQIFISATTANSVYMANAMLDAVVPYPDPGTVVMAIDIQNPQRPQLTAQKTLAGYDADIYLDSAYMVQIVRENWNATVLHVFDLNATGDLLSKDTEIRIPGQIPSEYHVKISNDTLFVIYRDEDLEKGSTLKIFDLKSTAAEDEGGGTESKSNLMAVERGAVHRIAPGEELYAATFMGNRAYIVTYERTDPLWVVDIADFDAPQIVGELEVPGWSEYIRFYNDRLIAVGYDDSDGKRRVSVALFSVEDPTRPELLDRVTPLKGEVDYTNSVALSDDRAFYFNSRSGLILLPIQYSASGSVSGLEILQINSDYNGFQWDHFVPARFYVQRGAEAGEIFANGEESGPIAASDRLSTILLSMGDAALHTIDISGVSSLKKPEALGELRLAYNVEKIALTDTDGGQTFFGVGGDYYMSTTSDLMRFDATGISPFQDATMEIPVETLDSELSYPEILISRADRASGSGGTDSGSDEYGVLFSWNDSAFRCFDVENMAMGKISKFKGGDHWMASEPLFRDHQLYFAVNDYRPIPMVNDDDRYSNEKEDRYGTVTTLKGFDCTNFNSPRPLPEYSIPGTPLALFNGRRLVTVEQLDYYYPYPYPLYEDSVPVKTESTEDGTPDSTNDEENGSVTDDIPASDTTDPDASLVPEPVEQGLRVNVLELSEGEAVLNATALFNRDALGYSHSQVICDESQIYLVSWKDESTEIRLLDADTLAINTRHVVEGQWSPVEASNGKMVLTNFMTYPYYYDIYVPYWNQNEVLVLAFSGDSMTMRLKDSINYYLSKQNLEIGEDALYVANGYKGIVVIPF